MISEGKLPCDADSYWQGERERMLRSVGLDVAACRDVVLQTGLCKESNVRCEVVLQAETCTYRPLQRSVECGLLFQFLHSVHEIACAERCIDWYLQLRAKTSVETPSPYIIYIIGTFQRYSEVVDSLLLADGVPVCAYLKF